MGVKRKISKRKEGKKGKKGTQETNWNSKFSGAKSSIFTNLQNVGHCIYQCCQLRIENYCFSFFFVFFVRVSVVLRVSNVFGLFTFG